MSIVFLEARRVVFENNGRCSPMLSACYHHARQGNNLFGSRFAVRWLYRERRRKSVCGPRAQLSKHRLEEFRALFLICIGSSHDEKLRISGQHFDLRESLLPQLLFSVLK